MRMFKQRIVVVFFFIVIGTCFAYPSHGQDYEVPTPRTVDEALGPDMDSGSQYRIEEPVQHDGYMSIYTVDSDYGVFLVHGDAMLRRLRQELTAIADMRERYAAGVAAEVLVEPIQAVGR